MILNIHATVHEEVAGFRNRISCLRPTRLTLGATIELLLLHAVKNPISPQEIADFVPISKPGRPVGDRIAESTLLNYLNEHEGRIFPSTPYDEKPLSREEEDRKLREQMERDGYA